MESQRVGIADGRPIVVSITIFRTMENGTKWQFWIDTGGTFTDCFGLPPVGALQRLKVLSSGHLRATVQEVIDPTTLRFQHQWSWTGMDLRGFYVQVTNGESLRVESVNWQESTLRLNGPVTATPGQLIDLWTGEEAPVTGMRLLTQTPLHRSLPPRYCPPRHHQRHQRFARTQGCAGGPPDHPRLQRLTFHRHSTTSRPISASHP
jgi:hypothetical protein